MTTKNVHLFIDVDLLTDTNNSTGLWVEVLATWCTLGHLDFIKKWTKRGERSIWPFQVLRIPNCLMALIIIVSLYKRDVYCARSFFWYLFTHWPSLLQSSLYHCHYRIHEYTLIVKGNISRLRVILCFEVILADWSKTMKY